MHLPAVRFEFAAALSAGVFSVALTDFRAAFCAFWKISCTVFSGVLDGNFFEISPISTVTDFKITGSEDFLETGDFTGMFLRVSFSSIFLICRKNFIESHPRRIKNLSV